MSGPELDSFREAYEKDLEFYEENILMLTRYSQKVLDTIRAKAYTSCMSLGIGHQVVSRKIIEDLAPSLERYLIIEGSEVFIRDLKKDIALPPQVSVCHSLFEEFFTDETFDAVEMGFVLEHVADPRAILQHYMKFIRQGGTIFIAVPNAKSLHRLVGNRAGLLEDIFALSESDVSLGHRRYFDLDSLRALLTEAGLKITATEGIFLKPFSTAQLKSLRLPPEVMTSLCSIGADYPGISNAIYIEATP